ncbi:uncharacterized protein Dana_GF21697 [Drosophila ananassae]|uniref:TRAF-type domain-containing protein n=1 Tax=Drosophila ananassae TaxID=7217 RepID=B3MV50_DROAN|nr:cysteine and histidine-rich protein 1 homolog [Drosophila ananassae]EDV33115.1 uncharacterized protein Dana_GF21697 [Drosophila ananassae]
MSQHSGFEEASSSNGRLRIRFLGQNPDNDVSLPPIDLSLASSNESLALEDTESDDELSNVATPSGFTERDAASNLEQRLNEVARCVVCKNISFTALFQCQRGHLICAGCYEIRVHDKLLSAGLSTCPECGVRINIREPSQNVVVESTVAEMPVACEHCAAKMPRSGLREHFLRSCPKRLVSCQYHRLGCDWVGEAPWKSEHETVCPVVGKSGLELLESLQLKQDTRDAKQRIISQILTIMQLPDLKMRRLQVLPQKTREGLFPLDTFVSVARFQAYHHRWEVLLKWERPNQPIVSKELSEEGSDKSSPKEESDIAPETCYSAFNTLMFKLRLESAADCRSTLVLSYTFVQGTYSEVRFLPNLCERCEFSKDRIMSPPSIFYSHTKTHCSKLVNERGIFTRLLMVMN